MDIKELQDAVQSQINRYTALKDLASLEFKPYLYTLIEDAYEYAQKLFDEICVAEDQRE